MAQEITVPLADQTTVGGNGSTGQQTSKEVSGHPDIDNPWLRVIGAFKDDPMLDAMMEEIYEMRRRQVAEVEAEIKAEDQVREGQKQT